MITYVYQFLHALTFSVITETVIVLLLCIILKKDKRISLIAGLGTVCTIPYVWFVFPTIFWYSASTTVYLAELFAFLLEVLLYKIIGKVSWKYAILFSLVANSASYFLGKL